jgi:long-chain fatty acid transport protein
MGGSMNRKLAGASLALLGVALAGTQARASGFGLRETSAVSTGDAFVGSARAEDAATVFSDPAGMVRLPTNEMEGAIHAIVPYAEFNGTDTILPGTPFAQPVPGSTGGNAAQAAPTLGAFGVYHVTPQLAIGFAVTNPFGERIRYPSDFVGRYQSLVSSITDVNLTLAAAYAIDQHFSIAIGPTIDYFHARLSNAINLGPVAALTGDAVADLHGEDTNAGYVVSGMYQLDPDTRGDITYRSRVSHTVTGQQDIFVPPLLNVLSPPTAGALRSLSSSAFTDITLPDSLTFGVYHRFNDRLSVAIDGQWTNWSLLPELTIIPSNGGPISHQNLQFRDSWFGGISGEYRALPALVLRAGFAYDESPVQDQYRTSRLPDADRYILGVGFSWSVLPNADLVFGYAHIFAPDVPIAQSTSISAGLLAGTYRVEADTYSVGYRFRF